jgi:exoribonuclease-2
VSELMIFVNSQWGKLLADARVAGLYRTQANGKVKMSTRPGEHQGLGLAHYLWSSSPRSSLATTCSKSALARATPHRS